MSASNHVTGAQQIVSSGEMLEDEDEGMAPLEKPGIKTTEFWGKTVVQVLIIAGTFLGLEIEQETAVQLVAGIEAAYVLGRSIVKGFQAR